MWHVFIFLFPMFKACIIKWKEKTTTAYEWQYTLEESEREEERERESEWNGEQNRREREKKLCKKNLLWEKCIYWSVSVCGWRQKSSFETVRQQLDTVAISTNEVVL